MLKVKGLQILSALSIIMAANYIRFPCFAFLHQPKLSNELKAQIRSKC